MMNAKVLVEALEDELRLHGALRDLGDRKRKHLVQFDVEAVDKTTRDEQTLLAALGETASRRLQSCRDMGKAIGMDEKTVSVRSIASKLPDPERSRLFTLASELRRKITEVSRVTHSNRVLTEQSLTHVQSFFDIITGTSSDDGTYGRRGLQDARPARFMVDRVV